MKMKSIPNIKVMNKEDNLRPEYNLSALLKAGERGKFAEWYKAGTNMVLLEPDVAQAFPNDDAVNEALRLVMQISKLKIKTGKGKEPVSE
jgi:hypothetical protein